MIVEKWKYVLVPERGNVLFIAPHPDDEIIGCGGTLLKHLLLGDNVEILYLSNGVECEEHYEKRKRRRITECNTVVKKLKVTAHFWKNENKVVCSKDKIIKLENILSKFNPYLIYITSIEERNREHREAAELLKKVLIRDEQKVINICEYPVWSPIMPNILVNITEFFYRKEELLYIYQSELERYKYDKLIEGAGKYYLNLFHPNAKDLLLLKQEYKLYHHAMLGWDYAEPFIMSNSKGYIERCNYYKMELPV